MGETPLLFLMRFSLHKSPLLPMISLMGLGLVACDSRAKTAASTTSVEKIDFNSHVRPILSDRCFACHGPDSNKGREAGLRLDTFDGATAKLESGNRAIVPGDLKASEMVKRMHTHDADDIMPPHKLNRPLTDAERKILERWIEQGAE